MRKFQQNAHPVPGQNHLAAGNGSSYHIERAVHSAPLQNSTHVATVQSAPVQSAPVQSAPVQSAPNQSAINHQALHHTPPPAQPMKPAPIGDLSHCDEELGHLFQQMRQLTRVDLSSLAGHLQTSPEVLATFERGELLAFPPWAETVRIVSSLALLVNIDCEPILKRISQKNHQPAPSQIQSERTPQNLTPARSRQRRQMSQPAPVRHQQPVAQQLAQPQPEARTGRPVQTKRPLTKIAFITWNKSAFTMRNLGLATIPVLMLAAFFLVINLEHKNSISGPLGNYARAGLELFSWNSNKDGLRWIKTYDPRSRKADKLPIKGNDD